MKILTNYEGFNLHPPMEEDVMPKESDHSFLVGMFVCRRSSRRIGTILSKEGSYVMEEWDVKKDDSNMPPSRWHVDR
jgi:hypothetical protein